MVVLFLFAIVSVSQVYANDNDVIVTPTVTNKRYDGADYEKNQYQDYLFFDITWDTSKLSKPTRAIKGIFSICNIFGDVIMRVKWNIDDPLTPNVPYIEHDIGFKYNQFIDYHHTVKNMKLENMTFTYEVLDVIYAKQVRVIRPRKMKKRPLGWIEK